MKITAPLLVALLAVPACAGIHYSHGGSVPAVPKNPFADGSAQASLGQLADDFVAQIHKDNEQLTASQISGGPGTASIVMLTVRQALTALHASAQNFDQRIKSDLPKTKTPLELQATLTDLQNQLAGFQSAVQGTPLKYYTAIGGLQQKVRLLNIAMTNDAASLNAFINANETLAQRSTELAGDIQSNQTDISRQIAGKTKLDKTALAAVCDEFEDTHQMIVDLNQILDTIRLAGPRITKKTPVSQSTMTAIKTKQKTLKQDLEKIIRASGISRSLSNI